MSFDEGDYHAHEMRMRSQTEPLMRARRQTDLQIRADRYSVTCRDLLASLVTLRGSERQIVATVRPRRLRSGYNVTTPDGRYTFDPHSHAHALGHAHVYAAMGTVTRRGGNHGSHNNARDNHNNNNNPATEGHEDCVGPTAVVRCVSGGAAIAVDIERTTFVLYASRGVFFVVDRLDQVSSSTAQPVRVGVVRAVPLANRKAARRTSPFAFDFMQRVPALLAPLIVIIIRESAAAAVANSSNNNNNKKHNFAAYALNAPIVALTAAVGAALC